MLTRFGHGRKHSSGSRTSPTLPVGALSRITAIAVSSALAIVYGQIIVASETVPGAATQVHLSWEQDPSQTLTVSWRTPSARNAAVVEYRIPGGQSWNRKAGTTRPSPGRGYLHSVTLTDLAPATEYEYRVSNDNGVEPSNNRVFSTRTAPQGRQAEYTFAFIADTGLSGRLDGNSTGIQQIINEVSADDPLFVLGGGDYAYANFDPRFNAVDEAIDAWFVQMEPLLSRAPFMAQYGNHEVFLVERFDDWAPRFIHPTEIEADRTGFFDLNQVLEAEVNYSFDVGPAHFTALFVPGPQLSPYRLAWLHRDLAEARARGLRWLIIYQHEPIFAHGDSHPADPRVRESLAPIFEKHRVDLHLSSHDQNYERTYPLLGVPQELTLGSRSRAQYRVGDGVIYAKVSPSGKMSERRNDFSRFTTAQQEFIALRDDTAHHYALVTVRGTAELQLDVFSVVGDRAPKRLIDSFRIRAAQ